MSRKYQANTLGFRKFCFSSLTIISQQVFFLIITLSFIFIYGISVSKVYAQNTTDITTISALEQRLKDEQMLFQISQDLFKHIEGETADVLEQLKHGKSARLKSPNYILEQFRLQAIKTNLQAQRIKIDRETIKQEVIATDNAIYQLENKLQSILGPGKQAFINSDLSVNTNIKQLQSDINYHKRVSEINARRLKLLISHYDLIYNIKTIEDKFLMQLQVIIEDIKKKQNIEKLNQKEALINEQIQVVLEQELKYKDQIRSLDIVRHDNNEGIIKYNSIYIKIIEAVNKRGILELDLSLLRLDSRLSEVIELFENENKSILKNKKNLSERLLRLQKESTAIKELINNKLSFVNDYKNFIDKEMQVKNISLDSYNLTTNVLADFTTTYKDRLKSVSKTINQLDTYLKNLNELYLKDISIRQNLPEGLGEWQAILADFISIPYLLSKQFFVSSLQFQSYFKSDTSIKLLKVTLFELVVLLLIITFYKFVNLLKLAYTKPSLERFSNLVLYVLGNFLLKDRFVIALFFNTISLLWITEVSGVFINIFVLISALYLLIRFVLNFCYIFLVENTLQISGDDSRLYKGLKYSLYFGAVLYAFMILGQSLGLSLSTLDFIDRLFMLFLLAISYPLIINWQVMPQLIVDGLNPKPYVRRAIWLLGIIVPVTILSNAALGIIGYVNLAWKIAVAEVQLSLVITLWLISRGLFSELMEMLSRFFIRNVTNGWLWTESVLKPLHTVINVILFISAILGLVMIYGWNSDLELLTFIDNTLDYHLFTLPASPPEEPVKVFVSGFLMFCIIFALVMWATKWSREFSYRWLYAKTKDLAVRNSFSVFTQYTTLAVGIIIILKVLGIPTASLMVALGGFLLFLGFGLRDIISNYVSGIILLIERQVRTGDLVTIGEHEGKVTKIGVRSLTVESFDNMEVIVPNTDTITKPLINWTFKDTIIRMELSIRVSYETDLDKFRELIYTTFKSIEAILEDPRPKVNFKEFSDSAIIAKIYYFIDLNKTPGRSSIRTDVMLAINKVLHENNIKIAYPKQLVHLDK